MQVYVHVVPFYEIIYIYNFFRCQQLQYLNMVTENRDIYHHLPKCLSCVGHCKQVTKVLQVNLHFG